MGKTRDEIRLAELEEKVSGLVNRLEMAEGAAVQLESRVVTLEDAVGRCAELRG